MATDTASSYSGVPTNARELEPGDTFERHGRLWTVEEVGRGPWGCAHIFTTGGGHVWVPRGEAVNLRSSGAQVDLREGLVSYDRSVPLWSHARDSRGVRQRRTL